MGSNDVPSSLQEVIALAVRFDNLVTVRSRQQEPEHPCRYRHKVVCQNG